MKKKNEKDNNVISKESISKAYIESVKLHAKAIQEQIDLERSVIIYYSDDSWKKVLHVIELKTDDPDKERRCFCYNEADFNKCEAWYNPYVMAVKSPNILSNIPQWEDASRMVDPLVNVDFANKASDRLLVRNGWPLSYTREHQKMACPEKGAFTAYKKVYCNDQMSYICELLIPEDALRSSGFERKCRADKAKVVAIWDLDYVDTRHVMYFVKTRKRIAHSFYDKSFIYRVGETVIPTNGFDTDRFNTCAPGIHFFMTMAEAARYY